MGVCAFCPHHTGTSRCTFYHDQHLTFSYFNVYLSLWFERKCMTSSSNNLDVFIIRLLCNWRLVELWRPYTLVRRAFQSGRWRFRNICIDAVNLSFWLCLRCHFVFPSSCRIPYISFMQRYGLISNSSRNGKSDQSRDTTHYGCDIIWRGLIPARWIQRCTLSSVLCRLPSSSASPSLLRFEILPSPAVIAMDTRKPDFSNNLFKLF